MHFYNQLGGLSWKLYVWRLSNITPDLKVELFAHYKTISAFSRTKTRIADIDKLIVAALGPKDDSRCRKLDLLSNQYFYSK